MNADEVAAMAESFLIKSGICFLSPGKVIARKDGQFEVVFLIPEAMNPEVVVDPPDVWVLVDPLSGEASLVPMM